MQDEHTFDPMAEHDHAYLHAHGIAHSHDGEGHEHHHDGHGGEGHEHSHGHGHTHTHENTRAVLNRLSRAIGHLQSVKRMVEEGRDCSEVLIQIAAVRSAIDNTGKLILQDHLKHCIIDAAREGDQQAIDELNQAIEKFMN